MKSRQTICVCLLFTAYKIRNSGAAVYQILVCYFMAHEHLLKAHIYLHTASGDTPVLEYRRLRSHISKRITSRFFQKWCSSGVVSALMLRKTIDFTGFSGTFQDTAVADE